MQNTKQYDLEDRTLGFAKRVRVFIESVPKSIGNIEDSKQVIRSSGSIGANYIEANESLSKKDFVMRIMISRKEAKETQYWLKLIETKDSELNKERISLLSESVELTKIFGAILEKSK
jgi:four helix bundle protein